MTRARRASRPRFRLLPTVLLTLAILGLPTVVFAWGRSSSSFDVVSVRMTGTRLLAEKRVHRLLRREYTGRNLFTVTAGDVRRSLRPLRFVSAVSVDRDFPDTLAVSVTEYVPAVYARAGKRWYVLDEDGYVICTAAEAAKLVPAKRRASPKPSPSATASAAASATTGAAAAATEPAAAATASPAGAPSLRQLLAGPADATLPLPRVAVSGRVREGSVVRDEAVVEMIKVVTALPRSLRRSLAVVENEDGQITLRFSDGPLTVWGDAGRTLAKTVALRTVLRRYEESGQTCTRLDVSVPDRTLAKPVLK